MGPVIITEQKRFLLAFTQSRNVGFTLVPMFMLTTFPNFFKFFLKKKNKLNGIYPLGIFLYE